MEEVGADPGDVSSTIHCQKYNNTGTATEHATLHVADAEDEFHVYACEWTPDHLKFYVDGNMILDYANDGSGVEAWPFDKPFYIILNLAWGGDWADTRHRRQRTAGDHEGRLRARVPEVALRHIT